MSSAPIVLKEPSGNGFGTTSLIVRADLEYPHSPRLHGYTTNPEIILHSVPPQTITLLGKVSPDRAPPSEPIPVLASATGTGRFSHSTPRRTASGQAGAAHSVLKSFRLRRGILVHARPIADSHETESRPMSHDSIEFTMLVKSGP